MKRFLCAAAMLLSFGATVPAQQAVLDSLYDELDAAIDSAQFFLQQKTDQLEALKQQLSSANSDEQRFECTRRLYEQYTPFDNDSAIAYQYQCLDLAQRMGNDSLYCHTLLMLADQLTESGFYHEARLHFTKAAPFCQEGALHTAYLNGMSHLYGEMGYYSHDPRLRQQFFAEAAVLRDSLLTCLDSTQTEWMKLRTMMLVNDVRPDEAMTYCDRWQQLCQQGGRDYAIMAYYRSVIYGQQGDVGQQRQWLALSALTDIRNAIMDQGALWSLAETFLSEKQQLDRAHRYIDFSWQCLQRFSTHMRSWLVAPVVTHINDQYKQQLRTANNRLVWAIAAVSLLAVGLMASLFYVQRKRRQLALARARAEAAHKELAQVNKLLAGKNDELQQANELLQQANEQLRLAVMRQNDSNRVKDEYLGKFLSMCSEYVDKLDAYRIKVNRKLKANQNTDLLRMSSSEQLKEDELKELFDNFDASFLRLFPTFVNDFNALLRPDQQIVLSDKSRLNTELRIFALIRLGIDESSKIAEFLRYSPNSIYAYRARTKNKAAGNRNDFERLVKEIGMQG
jgi:hypothetical protein